MRVFGIIVIVALWLLFGWVSWSDMRNCCQDTAAVSQEEEMIAAQPSEDTILTEDLNKVEDGIGSFVGETTGPLTFRWNQATPVLSDEWQEMKRQLLEEGTENQMLQITGFYHEQEENTSSAENFGLARAEIVGELFSNELNEERIKLLGRIGDDIPENGNSFNAISFDWVEAQAEEEKIVNIGNRIDIYFRFNSVERIVDQEIENYLNQLSDRLKQTGERIILTGHTDNSGEPEVNRTLGMARANIIKNYLIEQGVPASRITTVSQGERQPVASNATSRGRAKNRRAELQIVQ